MHLHRLSPSIHHTMVQIPNEDFSHYQVVVDNNDCVEGLHLSCLVWPLSQVVVLESIHSLVLVLVLATSSS